MGDGHQWYSLFLWQVPNNGPNFSCSPGRHRYFEKERSLPKLLHKVLQQDNKEFREFLHSGQIPIRWAAMSRTLFHFVKFHPEQIPTLLLPSHFLLQSDNTLSVSTNVLQIQTGTVLALAWEVWQSRISFSFNLLNPRLQFYPKLIWKEKRKTDFIKLVNTN